MGRNSELARLARKTRILVVSLLVLTVIGLSPLNLLSESWGQARSPTFVKEILSCPGGFVGTPEGCVPKECSFGPTHQFDGISGDLTFDNGTHIVVPDHCLKGTPVVTITSVFSNGSQTSQTLGGSQVAPFPTNNWVEDAHYSNCFLGICAGLGGETGNWPVPTAPSNSNGQTIFMFLGLQPYCTFSCFIIQPVLTWGNGCYTWSGWSIASYYVSGSTCTWSTPKGVNPGDLISGAMWISGGCGHTCDIWAIKTTDQTTGVSTQLNQNQIDVVDAFVTLEVYNVINCGDYPASGQTQFSSLTVGPGAVSWGPNVLQNDGCGEAVNINNNAATVNLVYAPQGGGGGGGSVAAGTQILTPGGDVAVQDIKVGDTVVSIDPFTQQQFDSTITSINVVTVSNMLIFYTDTGLPLRVDVNPRLRFNAIHNGQPGLWSTVLLVPGDSLYQYGHGWTTITRIDRIYDGQHTYYDLHLNPLHDFIANGYSDCPCKT